MPSKVCEVCGKALTAFNHAMSSTVCDDCWPSAPEGPSQEAPQPARESLSAQRERAARKVVTDSFAAARPFTRESIADRDILESVPRLVVGLAIVAFTTFAGSCVGLAGGWLSSLIGCFVGLFVVNKLLFRRVHPLDTRRWRRFWSGAVLGYWIAYLPFVLLVVPRVASQQQEQEASLLPLVVELGSYALAFFFGLGVGVVNVLRTDRREKELVLACYDEWQAQTAAAQNAAAPNATEAP